MRRRLAVLVATLGVVTACGARGPASVPTRPDDTVDIQILAFNDFHGNLDPPTGSNGRIGDVEVGGAEYFASHIARLRATNPNTMVMAAGDNVGASPLLSSLFHDEPTIRVLGQVGLDYSSPGNHEFDEGWAEFLRMQHGGCHPTDGCSATASFDGASFEYLAANVRVDARRDTLFPATATRTFGDVTVGVIGLVLEGTPGLVSPTAVEGLTFLPAASTANAAAERLRDDGADVVVALIHEGGYPAAGDDEACGQMTGGLVDVVRDMAPTIDIVVSGHTNRSYICRIDGHLVTSTASYSREITDIDVTVDRQTGAVTATRAASVLVTRDVPTDPAVTAILDEYRPAATAIGSRPVGSVAGAFTRRQDDAGESSIGNLVADAYLAVAADASRGGAQVAFINWGGLRADLGSADGVTRPVAYSDAFQLLPFGNIVITRTLTGAQLGDLLEQQFAGDDRSRWQVLQPSRTLRYRWSAERPAGSRVDRASIRVGDMPLDPAAGYRVAMPDFLWNGGDGFTAALAGTDALVVGTDVDILIEYLGSASPVRLTPTGRIERED